MFSARLSTFLATAVLIATVSTSPMPLRRQAIDAALVPEFGVVAGTNPTGTGDCDGVNGIKIPCTCPPERDFFIGEVQANVEAGRARNNNGNIQVSFPTGNSKEDQLARLNTATVTLQNLFGSGVGCPQAATTFGAQRQAIEAGTSPAPAPAAPAAPVNAPAAPAPAAPAAAGGVDPALVPDFGIVAGTNPTGTGDCDGVNGIKIPCTCPPERAFFIQELNANVEAGRARNNDNPNIAVSFPTGNSKADQLTRLNAATVTLQNLFGSGKGCPQAATTFGAQSQAINALPN